MPLVSRLSQLRENIDSACEVPVGDETIPVLPRGWALRKNKPHVVFSTKQRQYLTEKFNEGVAQKKKWDQRQLAAQMRKEVVNGLPVFEAVEYLKPQQIAS